MPETWASSDDYVPPEMEENSPEGPVNTHSPRLPRDRERRIPHGAPDFYKLTEYFYSSGVDKGKKWNEQLDSEPPRSDYIHRCVDTIRNPDYDSSKYGVIADDGGDLKLFKIEWVQDQFRRFDFSNPWYIRRSGIAYCKAGSFTHEGINVATSLVPPSVDLNTTQYGPTLWDHMKPAKPVLSVGQFIAESRDLPRLLHARLEGLKSIGDFYLAVKFGWEPLLRDIMDFLRFSERFSKNVAFIIDNAGKPIRRSTILTVPTEGGVLLDQSGSYSNNWILPLVGSMYFGGSPVASRYKQKLTYTVNKQVWGSGMFKFWFNPGHVPTTPELIGKLAGLELTPKLLWEVIPWSWLIDYFSNIGDMISNIYTEVADQQVSIYAYGMVKTERTYTWWATDGFIEASVSRRFTVKARDKIHPFGLAAGTTLSNSQKAIMAALATSRLPKH